MKYHTVGWKSADSVNMESVIKAQLRPDALFVSLYDADLFLFDIFKHLMQQINQWSTFICQIFNQLH